MSPSSPTALSKRTNKIYKASLFRLPLFVWWNPTEFATADLREYINPLQTHLLPISNTVKYKVRRLYLRGHSLHTYLVFCVQWPSVLLVISPLLGASVALALVCPSRWACLSIPSPLRRNLFSWTGDYRLLRRVFVSSCLRRVERERERPLEPEGCTLVSHQIQQAV